MITAGILRCIQRRADIKLTLERTILDCPQFVAVLTDLPTLSTGFANLRSDDGPWDESERECSCSGPSRIPSPDNDPGFLTPESEDNGKNKDPDNNQTKDNNLHNLKLKEKRSEDKR